MTDREMDRDRTPGPKPRQRGQGLLELVVILPVLLILMVGVAEIGVGLRTYLLVINANREAARFAARGRYDDNRVAERVISAGGVVELGGTAVPFLRPSGTEPKIKLYASCGGEPGIDPATARNEVGSRMREIGQALERIIKE